MDQLYFIFSDKPYRRSQFRRQKQWNEAPKEVDSASDSVESRPHNTVFRAAWGAYSESVHMDILKTLLACGAGCMWCKDHEHHAPVSQPPKPGSRQTVTRCRLPNAENSMQGQLFSPKYLSECHERTVRFFKFGVVPDSCFAQCWCGCPRFWRKNGHNLISAKRTWVADGVAYERCTQLFKFPPTHIIEFFSGLFR